MKKGLQKPNLVLLLCGLLSVASLMLIALHEPSVDATTGVNQTINFQGRLLNSQGATVPDGFYNIEFKIYQDGDGQSANDSTGSPSGSLKWTEDHLNSASHGVKVVNGYLSVQLGSVTPFGSSVNWNQDTLWLSMNVGNTNSSCSPFSSCSGDGEMLPMQPMTSSPFALNSGQLGGLTSSQFVQLGQGVQTDASNVVSIGVNKTSGTGNILQLQRGGVDVMAISNNGSVLFQPNSDSSTAFQVENHSNGYSVFTVDTSGNQVVLGKASNLTGKLAFATAGGGTLTINPTSSASNFTITFPGETGTVCTTAASGVCNTAGGLSNVAYLNQDQTFTGKNTFSHSGSTSNDYAVGLTGTPAASSTSSLLRLGNAISGGNGAANGGTYLSINEPGSGAGSAADFLNLQNNNAVQMQLTSSGNLTVAGTYNTNTFSSSNLAFGANSAASVKSNGSNNITVDTGSSGGSATFGNSAATDNIGTSNAAHAIHIGDGGTSTDQTITIGSAGTTASTLTLQGGNGSTAIQLQTGNNGTTTAGSIIIGNTSGAFNQTISIGTNNSAANTVQIGTGTGQDSVTIGNSSNASSSVTINAGSTGGITLGAGTTISANKDFTYAAGSGKFDAHNSTGTFDTSSGTNSLNGATTVTGTNTFTVNGGLATLKAGALVQTGSASTVGTIIQGTSSQSAALLQLQDSTGAAVLSGDAGGNQEQIGYLNTPYGGLGNYSNLITYSEQLNNAAWSTNNASVTANQVQGPDNSGSNTADIIHATSSGGSVLNASSTAVSNNNFTFSVWLKTDSGTQNADLRIDGSSSGTGTAKRVTVSSTWQRFSVTQNPNGFGGNVTGVIFPGTTASTDGTTVYAWGAQLVQASIAQVYVRTTGGTVAANDGLINNGNAIFQNLTNSASAYQFQNASGANVATIDTSNGQVVLGSGSGSVTGQIKFNYSGQTGSITLAVANPSSTGYTITLPAENGTVCTNASTSTCATAGAGYVQLAPAGAQSDGTNNTSIFINKTSGTGNLLLLQRGGADNFKIDNSGNVTSVGQNTLSRSGSGSSDYTLGVTGAPSASSTSSLVRIGSAISGGNGAANGGTYLSIGEPGSGAGSAADFLNLQNNGAVQMQLTSTGNLTVAGTYNTNTFTSSNLAFGANSAASVKSNGTNDITFDTGSSGGTATLGNNAATTNIGTSNAAHTIGIGTGGGGTNTEAVTIGAATNSSSTLTLQGGSGSSAIQLQTGNNGTTTAGTIVIGNTSGAFSQTISVGSANTTSGGTNIVNIGTASTAQDSVAIGSTSNANSSVTLNGGSTGGVTLNATTTNINSATISTNQSNVTIFGTNATNVTAFGAGTTITIGATSGTITLKNANTTLGNAAGSGVFTNNGATLNSTLALGDFNYTGSGNTGSIGSAASTVDIYTSISIGQTTASQTLTIPSPTASTTYGRTLYLANIGTTSFIVGGIRIPSGSTATLVWSNTNGGASWQFAGAGGASIENQNSADQTADFRINGTGRANTSFTSPLFDSITGAVGLGTATATGVNIGGTTNTTSIVLQGAASATYTLGTSNNTGGITVGNSTASNTIAIGTAAGNAAVQTINIGTSSTSGSTTNTTVGSTIGSSSTTIQAGSNGITLSGNTTVSGSNTFSTGTGSVSLKGDTTVSNGKNLILGSNSSDLSCTSGAIFYRSDTNRFRGCENGTWIYIDNFADVQTYTSGDNTWTKPTNASAVEVILVGGGGGGGGGGARNGGQERNGGGGGGGGAYASQIFAASDLASTAHAIVGGAGSSGAGAASSATAGTSGGAGGDSCFSSTSAAGACTGTLYTKAYGGGGGGGGNQAGTAGGAGGGGGGAAAAGSTPANTTNTGGTGGNPAGGAANTNVAGGAGAGGGSANSGTANAGNAGGAAEYGGGGGGGAAGGNSASGNGGSSLHGAGGGGAGASTNSGNSTGTAGAGGVSQSNTSGGGGAAGTNGAACTAGNGLGANGGAGTSIKSGSGGGGGGANGGGNAVGCGGGNGGSPGGGGGGGGSGSASAGAGGTGAAGEIWVISW
jgi:hypothetical protein